MTNNSFIISNGTKPIALVFAASVFAYVFVCETLGHVLLLITLLLMYIYRNPERDIKRNDSEILSICDGTVNTIDVFENHTDIYINVSILDTHILRAPMDGDIKIVSKRFGLNLNPNSFLATKLNESLRLRFENLDIEFLSGFFNSKIHIDSQHNLIKGDKFGSFLNGIIKLRFEHNENIKLNVKIGDKLQAGKTIIAFNK
jgi:phosphatidylserine decarboxylase